MMVFKSDFDAARHCVLVKHADYHILGYMNTWVFWSTGENHIHTPWSLAS